MGDHPDALRVLQRHGRGLHVAVQAAQVTRVAKAAIHLREVARVIAMGKAFKYRIENQARNSKPMEMLNPPGIHQLAKTMRENAVVLIRRPA